MESLDMATKVSLDLRSAACTPGSTSTKVVVVVVLDLVEDEAVISVPVVLLVATEEALRALLVLLLLIFRGGIIRLLLPWHALKGRRDDDEKDPIALILDPIRPAVPLRTGAAKL